MIRRQLGWIVVVATLPVLAAVGGCVPSPCDRRVLEAARAEQAAIAAAAPQPSSEPDAGLVALTAWDALPTLTPKRYTQFSSYNRAPDAEAYALGGKDFNNFIAQAADDLHVLLEWLDGPGPEDGDLRGYVLADVSDGPGYVSRMFFTRFAANLVWRAHNGESVESEYGRFENEVLRIYVDDLRHPAYILPLADVGVVQPFAEPLCTANEAAATCYTPISFRSRLRIALDGLCPLNGYYYQIDVQQTVSDTQSFSARLDENPIFTAARDLLAAFNKGIQGAQVITADDATHVLPASGTTIVLAADGGGTIEQLRFHFDNVDADALRHLLLQVYYEDAAEPAIAVPLDAFFGCREQLASFETLPIQVTRDGPALDATCNLPMPFRDHIRVQLRNDGPEDVTLRSAVRQSSKHPAEPWGYLHARFNAVAGPQPPGSQFEVIDVNGRGRYVGTFLYAAGEADPNLNALSGPLNILEGNETGIIDGEVRIRGTGTEDYTNAGFYYARGLFSRPFAAANYVSDAAPGVASACRWHVLSDAIDFENSFVLRFQYGPDNPALVVRYATTAYYYLNRAAPGDAHGGNVIVAPVD